MKKLVVLIFISLCILSTFVLPRVIYGTFATVSGKQVDDITDEEERITHTEALQLDAAFASDPNFEYSRYQTLKKTWYADNFWLKATPVDTIKQGIRREERDNQ